MASRSVRKERRGERSRRWTTRVVAGFGAALLGVGVLPGLPTAPAQAADGQGFNLNASDLAFILKQIKIAERHASTPLDPDNPCAGLLGTAADQIPNQNAQGAELPWGLRTVDGSCNNLKAGQSGFGAAGRMFPRRAAANFRQADATPPQMPAGNGSPTSYDVRTGFVYDTQPRVASNLIVDQTRTNPAARAAAGVPEGTTPPAGTLFIENVAPDVGLSAPFNSTFTLFGQFFDHGLDLVGKTGGTVFVPLKADDPLIAGRNGILGDGDDLAAHLQFMVLTRAITPAGPDGVPGTADDDEATNKTAPYVDQSQTYTSHPSHQAFLREYTDDAAVEPVVTGRMLTGPGDGLATWADVKTQAAAELGIVLTDADIFDVPLLATDQYGTLELSTAGKPQFVTATGLVETNPGAGVPVPANAVRTGHSFLDDIAHNAVPKPAQPAQGPTRPAVPALTADTDASITGATGVQDPGTYDDEMLDAHFVAGDGRINENIGLTAVHHVFHSEHNRLADNINDLLTEAEAANPASTVLEDWRSTTGPAGWDYGERLFQAARFVTEMEYQHLAFEEFARKVQPQVNLFSGYDTSIDAAITAEFAHAVYRFGHSMLTESVDRRTVAGADRNIDLLDAFLNPPAFYDGGIDPDAAVGDIVRGMTAQRGNEIDEFVTEALRNNLLGLPLDLAVLNMARARETGVPSLNEARRTFFQLTNGNSALAPYENWIDFGLGLRHHESLINFVAAYGTHPDLVAATTSAEKRRLATLIVAGNTEDPATPAGSVEFMQGNGGLEDVDLWVGGLAERQAPFGGLLGSTFNFIFETQMEDLQDGDRLYYLSRTAGLNLLVQLEGNSFAELISRNSNAENLPADVFSSPDLVFNLSRQTATGPIANDPDTTYDERFLLTRMADGTIRYAGALHVLFVGTANVDRMRSSEGDDTMRGNELNDRLEGGAGNDQMIGGSGQDVLTDTFGDDVLKGGDGNDAMSSGAGFDLNQGGRGDDFVVGGSDPTETFGGPGDDMIFGGDSSDTIFGDDGDDWLEGGAQADLVQGDNGAPFQDDPNTPGHDVLNGNGGQDDYDAEGGDDILVAGAGIERNEGMLGFDWVTHKNDPQAADDDLDLSVFLPPSVDALRDRFDLVEAVSGGNQNDTLRGDDVDAAALGADNDLDAEGIARINGLSDLVGATGFTGGNIIIGGEGSDLIEGRGGDDVIHGDVWLNVQLRAPNVATADTTDVVLVDSMSALQADVFAGRLNAGDIEIVRSIVTSEPGSFTDTAVFSGARAEYDVTVNADGTTTVAHVGGTAADGTDTLRGIEVMQFADAVGATAPTAPLNVAATAGNTQATVTFTGPASDGGSPITEFEIDVLSGTTLVRTVAEIAPNARSVVVPNLVNGTVYTFVVRAINAIGGTDSDASAEVTPHAPAVVPPAPTIGAATAGNASATVVWTAPAGNGGSAITGYQVEVRVNGVAQGAARVAPASATSLAVTGLTNGTAYTFRVQAVNAVGVGAPSATSNSVTPTVPATVPAAPTIGTATGGNASATVRWTAPAGNGGSAITGYQVEVRANGVAQGAARVAPASATSLAVTGLTNGTAYTFRVWALNAVGQGALSAVSNTVTPTAVVAGAPTIGTATAGNASATVRWTAPASNGGSTITSYSVQVRNASGTVLRTVTGIPGAAVSTTVTALSNGTAYNFRVRANNAAGAGALSAASNTVRPVRASVPGAPRGVVATSGSAGGPRTASIRWVAPASNGGSAITSYRATAHRIGANGAVVGTQTSGVLAPTARAMTFFVNATGNYRFTIQAVNAAGTGPHSAMSNQVIGR